MSIPHAQKYREKPVTVEAMQWDGTAAGGKGIIDWVLEHDVSALFWTPRDCLGIGDPYIKLDTPDGYVFVIPGDYVIKGVQGEFYLCKPDIFAKTYELTEVRA